MWSIALKSPGGTNSICFHETSHSWMKTDINEWINKIFNHRKWKGYICYNDDPPNENVIGKLAHAKGVVLWNNNVLGWFMHSCSNWPTLEEMSDSFHMKLPENVLNYGQSFAYIEMPIHLYTMVMHQLFIMDANVYTSFPPNAYKKCHVSNKINYIEIDDDIIHLAKSPDWGKDIFDDWIYKQFGSGFVETWIKPIQKHRDHINNLQKIKWFDDTTYDIDEDHSKYAFSDDETNPWVYIGDLNHMNSPSKRGGGGFVFKYPDLWKAFRQIVYLA
jgi:hypothetical protein